MQVSYFDLPRLATGIVPTSANCVALSRLTRIGFRSVYESRWKIKASTCLPPEWPGRGTAALKQRKKEEPYCSRRSPSVQPDLASSSSLHHTTGPGQRTQEHYQVREDIVKCTAPLDPKEQKGLLYCINGLYVTLQFTGCSSPGFSSFVIPDSILRSLPSILNLLYNLWIGYP